MTGFELQVFGAQMGDAERVVADFPQITFVLVHAGMLESDDPETVAIWETGMQRLAAHDNVVVKLTGLELSCAVSFGTSSPRSSVGARVYRLG